MKTKSLIAVAFFGTLAVLPAHGFGYWNNATYASRYRPAPEAQAKPEFQVAVMATLPGQTPAQAEARPTTTSGKTADASHPFGPPKPYASHGR
jgi:hypothetical protein